MYERVQNALEEYGEIMIRLASGTEHELHIHNTAFIDDPIIQVDADDEIHWFNAEQIERYWIHYDF